MQKIRYKGPAGLSKDVKPASDFTIRKNYGVYKLLDFADTTEAECASRGLIEAPDELELKAEDGRIIWSQKAYAFIDEIEKAPDSANPSLWENTRNNHVSGMCSSRYAACGKTLWQETG